MGSHKVIEYTTQAMAQAATEVKGVEPKKEIKVLDKLEESAKNLLKSSELFNVVREQDKLTDRFGRDI